MCPPFQRRSWQWECQSLSQTEKEREEGQNGQNDLNPKSPGADVCSLPSASPRQGQAPWKKERKKNTSTLLWLVDLWVFPASASHLRPAAGPRGPLSSGSGHSATGSPCGAILWSPLIGWSGGGPVRPQTASGGCKRCRRRRLRWCARAGWGWWCGWACCSWRALRERPTTASGRSGFGFIRLFSTHGCRSKSDGSPFPPPGFPAPPARTRSSRDRRSCCEHTKKGQNVKSAIWCRCAQDFTGARGRKGYQIITPTPHLATAAELRYREKPPVLT